MAKEIDMAINRLCMFCMKYSLSLLQPKHTRLLYFFWFLLAQLKSQGLSRNALHIIFTAIVLSVVTYALQSFARQPSKGDTARIDSLFCKTFRQGFCSQIFSICDLMSAANKKLFRQI